MKVWTMSGNSHAYFEYWFTTSSNRSDSYALFSDRRSAPRKLTPSCYDTIDLLNLLVLNYPHYLIPCPMSSRIKQMNTNCTWVASLLLSELDTCSTIVFIRISEHSCTSNRHMLSLIFPYCLHVCTHMGFFMLQHALSHEYVILLHTSRRENQKNHNLDRCECSFWDTRWMCSGEVRQQPPACGDGAT